MKSVSVIWYWYAETCMHWSLTTVHAFVIRKGSGRTWIAGLDESDADRTQRDIHLPHLTPAKTIALHQGPSQTISIYSVGPLHLYRVVNRAIIHRLMHISSLRHRAILAWRRIIKAAFFFQYIFEICMRDSNSFFSSFLLNLDRKLHSTLVSWTSVWFRYFW